jgi:tripeptide aminopeptidase
MDVVEKIFLTHGKAWQEGVLHLREMLLANLVMVAQIPARSFQEGQRAAFVLDRFIECDLRDPHMDEIGNVVGYIPGKSSKGRILISAHLDSIFPENADHNVTISTDRAEGTGIADNAMGLTAMITLPDILKHLNIQFEHDLVFIATVASKEKGDLAGIRHYMEMNHTNIKYNINIEGITLGQVDHSSLSRVRCDISCNMDASTTSSWRSVGQNSAIMMLSDVLDSMYSIPLPRKPKTVMNIGKISGGNSYSRICEHASLSLEVRSEDDLITEKVIEDIKDNCRDISAKYGLEVKYHFFSRHFAAGLRYSHPMVRSICAILKKLDITLTVGLSNSEIAIPLRFGIPSITIGITTGAEDREGQAKSYVDLAPISTGVMQLLAFIQTIDQGSCDEEPQ